MNHRIKKTILLIPGIILAVFTTACAVSHNDQQVADLPITAQWSFYCINEGDKTLERSLTEDWDSVPWFDSEDGETFRISMTGEKFFNGTMVRNEDGSYVLSYDEEREPLVARIKGDELTITILGRIDVVFLGDDE